MVQGNQVVLSVKVGTNHGQHPGLAPILQDGLEAAFALGIRVMESPNCIATAFCIMLTNS
jgi:hypothetical protein